MFSLKCIKIPMMRVCSAAANQSQRSTERNVTGAVAFAAGPPRKVHKMNQNQIQRLQPINIRTLYHVKSWKC